ncbi:TPA: AAA family ATPase [Pseudomonas aeruginosa]|nr:AAA family ATPase [Pseudomonas aeruginosa]
MNELIHMGVRGLRSFGYKLNPIPFRKINIYVGQNSCGKSTYLRTFPLLRQSVESDTRFPILWYAGHGSYVDFGNFESALHDSGDAIHFDFKLKISPAVSSKNQSNLLMEHYYISSGHGSPTPISYHVDLSISLKKEGSALITTIALQSEGSKVELNYSADDVISLIASNDKHEIVEQFSTPLQITKGSLIPTGVFRGRQITIKSINIPRFVPTNTVRQESLTALSKYLHAFHHKSKQLKNVRDSLNYLALGSKKQLSRNLKALFSSDKYFIKKFEENSEEIVDVTFTYLLAKNIGTFWESADETLKKFYSGVRYLGPLRASAERFYRHQDLQISEVDHTGANLPMVINSLSEDHKAELTEWVKNNFGFDLRLETTGLHYALLIKEDSDSNYHNVSDMGFGYSQILPVIVSIWLELVGDRDDKPSTPAWFRDKASRTIVIEQPELHLHPALQYKFGSAIAKVASLVKDRDYNFVIETHSKHLIDAIGESISSNLIDEDQVNITLFEKKSSGISDIALSGFDSDGYLKDWPAGFLSA